MYPKMDSLQWKFLLKWMMTRGTPVLGTPISSQICSRSSQGRVRWRAFDSNQPCGFASEIPIEDDFLQRIAWLCPTCFGASLNEFPWFEKRNPEDFRRVSWSLFAERWARWGFRLNGLVWTTLWGYWTTSIGVRLGWLGRSYWLGTYDWNAWSEWDFGWLWVTSPLVAPKISNNDQHFFFVTRHDLNMSGEICGLGEFSTIMGCPFCIQPAFSQ